jgi:hypothetical protein
VQLNAIDQLINNQLTNITTPLPPNNHSTPRPLDNNNNNINTINQISLADSLIDCNNNNQTNSSRLSSHSDESTNPLNFRQNIEPLSAVDLRPKSAAYNGNPIVVPLRHSSYLGGSLTNLATMSNHNHNNNHQAELNNFELIDKALITSRTNINNTFTTTANNKNVKFNNDIDVRVFNKNSKNTRIIDAYVLPLTHQQDKNNVEQNSLPSQFF